MHPYRDPNKLIVKLWRLPYTMTIYRNNIKTGKRIHWSEYWEKELNKLISEGSILISHSICVGISNATNPMYTAKKEEDKEQYYGVLVTAVFHRT